MMKKILLTFIIALTATTFLVGQDVYLTWNGKKLNDTVYIWGEPAASQIVFNAIFHNNSDNGMNVLVVRKEMLMLDNTSSTFCWGLCYSPSVDTSSEHPFIPAGGQSDSTTFTGDYYPNNVIGTSIIRYSFFNMDNPDQRVEVIAKYWASPTGIPEDIMSKGSVSNIYPNPAGNYVTIDYELTPKVSQARVRIFNLLGSTVREAVMEKGANQIRINVSDLQNGVYFYSVLINGDIYKTKKLVIRR